MYLKKQEKCSQDGGASPCLGRQILLSPTTPRHIIAPEELKVGSFYEINHAKLSAKCPDQLKSIRVVMLSEKNEGGTSLRFPSLHSLRMHFNISARPEGKMQPSLDEKYVMAPDIASQVLLRRISSKEFAEKRDSWSFWVSSEKSSSSTPSSPIRLSTVLSKKGSCWSELKCNGMVRWGKRRQVRFLSRHDESNYNLKLLSFSVRDDDRHEKEQESEIDSQKKGNDEKVASAKLGVGLKEEEKNGEEKEEEEEKGAEEEEGEGDEEEDGEEEEDDDDDDDEDDDDDQRSIRKGPTQTRSKMRKRKCHSSSTTTSRIQKIKRARMENSKMQIIPYSQKNRRKLSKSSIDRWSAERYKLAEQNMLKILREKGAVYGNPILRPALRLEARKLIGDTGLLDHLLKHMAGKVAPGGKERFRRRHNADGAMEYWLENADLVKIREEAGVQDPYWTPPPGWKLGDSPSQYPVCARELKFLKEEIAQLKRAMQEILSRNKEEDLAIVVTTPSLSSDPELHNANCLLLPLKEMYNELLRKKAEIEVQLQEISHSLNGMQLIQEDMERFKSTIEEPKNSQLEETSSAVSEGERKGGEEKNKAADAVIAAAPRIEVKEDKAKVSVTKTGVAAEDKAAGLQRKKKSGFTICKPPGTFLWPSMSLSSPRLAVEDLLGAPTPPSVTSSSTAHHRLLPDPTALPSPTSPVKPMAEKRLITLAAPAGTTSPTAAPPMNGPPSSPPAESKRTEEQSNAPAINLNELPNNCPSSLTYKRRLNNPMAITSPVEEAMTVKQPEVMRYGEEQQMKQKDRGCSPGPSSSSSAWLALATPSPNLSDSSHAHE